MQLKGKNIVLTGAQGGIGQCLLALLKEQQAKVIAIGRKPGPDIIQADLAESDSVNALCQELAKKDIDILINLAGIMYFGEVNQQSSPDLEKMIAVNLTTPIKLTQAVTPRMLKKKKGHIVNIGSIFGSLPFPYFSVYSSTKAGLKGFSDSLRREYKNSGISVTHISPRAVDTPFNTRAIDRFNERTNANIDSPETVAKVILNAIISNKNNINIGFTENIFIHANAFLPFLVDRALISHQYIASQILTGDHI